MLPALDASSQVTAPYTTYHLSFIIYHYRSLSVVTYRHPSSRITTAPPSKRADGHQTKTHYSIRASASWARAAGRQSPQASPAGLTSNAAPDGSRLSASASLPDSASPPRHTICIRTRAQAQAQTRTQTLSRALAQARAQSQRESHTQLPVGM